MTAIVVNVEVMCWEGASIDEVTCASQVRRLYEVAKGMPNPEFIEVVYGDYSYVVVLNDGLPEGVTEEDFITAYDDAHTEASESEEPDTDLYFWVDGHHFVEKGVAE